MKLLASVILLLLVSASAWYFFNKPTNSVLSTSEKKQAMAKILDREPVLSPKKETTWTTYKGKYISFLYPTDANVYKNNVSPAILESFSCGMVSPRISLAVQVAPGDSLEGYPAVVLRKEDDDYAEVEDFVFIKDSDGVEKSGFFAKGGKIYSVVVSGYQMEAIEEIYEKVTESVSFY